jgi:hypothetical protein
MANEQKKLLKFLTSNPVLRIRNKSTPDDEKATKVVEEYFGKKVRVVRLSEVDQNEILPEFLVSTSRLYGLENIENAIGNFWKLEALAAR